MLESWGFIFMFFTMWIIIHSFGEIRSKVYKLIGIFCLFITMYVFFIKMIYLYAPGEMVGKIGDWISFSGGCIGAIGAILGVYFQFENEKKNRKEDFERGIIEKQQGAIEFFKIFFEQVIYGLENLETFFFNATTKGHNLEKSEFLKSKIPSSIYWEMYNKLSDTPIGKDLLIAFEKIGSMDENIKELLEKSNISRQKILRDSKFEKIKNRFLKEEKDKIDDIISYLNDKLSVNSDKTEENIKRYEELKYYYMNLRIILFDEKNKENIKITSLKNMKLYIENIITKLNELDNSKKNK